MDKENTLNKLYGKIVEYIIDDFMLWNEFKSYKGDDDVDKIVRTNDWTIGISYEGFGRHNIYLRIGDVRYNFQVEESFDKNFENKLKKDIRSNVRKFMENHYNKIYKVVSESFSVKTIYHDKKNDEIIKETSIIRNGQPVLNILKSSCRDKFIDYLSNLVYMLLISEGRKLDGAYELRASLGLEKILERVREMFELDKKEFFKTVYNRFAMDKKEAKRWTNIVYNRKDTMGLFRKYLKKKAIEKHMGNIKETLEKYVFENSFNNP